MNGTQIAAGPVPGRLDVAALAVRGPGPAGQGAPGQLDIAVRGTGSAGQGAPGHLDVAVRGAGPADQGALGEFFAGLSARSRYLRFFSPVTVGPGLLGLLSGGPANVDVVVAVSGGAIIGHAMAADRAEDPGTTDIGVVVADAWQDRGVGSALVRALADRARARGVTSMAMDVMHANHRVLAMIAGRWPAAEFGRCRDYATVLVRLRPVRAASRARGVSSCVACRR